MKYFESYIFKTIKDAAQHRFFVTLLMLIVLRVLWGLNWYKPLTAISNVMLFLSCAYWLFIVYQYRISSDTEIQDNPIIYYSLKASLIFLGGTAFSCVILGYDLNFILFLFMFSVSYVLTTGAILHEKKFHVFKFDF